MNIYYRSFFSRRKVTKTFHNIFRARKKNQKKSSPAVFTLFGEKNQGRPMWPMWAKAKGSRDAPTPAKSDYGEKKSRPKWANERKRIKTRKTRNEKNEKNENA